MRAGRHLSLKALLTVWFTLVMVAIAAVTCVFVALVSKDTVNTDMRRTLVTRVQRNARDLEENDGRLEIEGGFDYEWDGVFSAVFGSDGTALSGELPADASALPLSDRAVQTLTADGQAYYVYDRYVPLDGGGVWVRGMTVTVGTVSTVGALGRLALVIVPAVVVLAAAGGYLIAALALRPLERVSAAADEISGGADLSRRIDHRAGSKEVARLAGAFNGMMGRLEESFRREKQFVSDASHELRTPTAVIVAECDYALANARDDADWRESAETVRRQAGRMTALIGQLLRYARLEQGTARMEPERLELGELAAVVAEEQSAVTGVPVAAELAPGVFVRGDGILLTRLVTNLVGNACKFGASAVTVRLTREAGEAVLSVADDGVGIAPAEQARIFDRFYQTDRARSAGDGGSGLGLAMVKQIAALHGGAVAVESEEGRGSTFTFRMPAETPD